jgi:hypothetical protein
MTTKLDKIIKIFELDTGKEEFLHIEEVLKIVEQLRPYVELGELLVLTYDLDRTEERQHTHDELVDMQINLIQQIKEQENERN